MSSLHDKLSALRSSSAPSRSSARFGLRVFKTRSPVPDALYLPVAYSTLSRMGFTGDWPGAEQLLFLDTETTGLAGGAGTIVFLLGAGYVENGEFVVEQYLLGDYCDEPELISSLAALMPRFKAVVTFNGDAFDLPLIWSRATMNRMTPLLTSLNSYDCLKPARRLWKKRLGSVRLSVLEREILRRGRTDDLPGSEAPKRFFEYLKTANRDLLAPVVEHNRLDVVSMAYLLCELTRAYADPASQREPLDLMSMGRTMEKTGDRQSAIACYSVVSMPRSINSICDLRFKRSQGEAYMALGLIYKRMGERERACEQFLLAVERGRSGPRAMLELAKHCEHVSRDYDRALYWTDRALEAEADPAKREALEKRRGRLLSRR